MKKIFKKHGAVKCIGGCLSILGVIAAIVLAFLNVSINLIFFKILACALIFIGLFMMALMAKEHKTFKIIGACMLAIFLFSWILPIGGYQGATFIEQGMRRLGAVDIGVALYQSMSFTLDKLLFLFALAGFYGILSHISGYQQLVTKIAKGLKEHSIIVALVMSLLITAFTVLSRQTFAVLIFIPFFIAILAKMKVDKISTLAITFGSMLIGILGTLYGTDSLSDFNYYVGTEITTGLTYRGIILAVAFVLFNFFIVMRLRKMAKAKNNEVVEDPFAFEAPRKKALAFPAAIILGLGAIITILGYIAWNTNWGIEVFDKFHEWLTTLAIGKDYTIFSYLLSSEQAVALGNFSYLFYLVPVMLMVVVLLAIIYRAKLNDLIAAFAEGVKVAVKPALIIVSIYTIFVFAYMSPGMASVINFGWAKPHFNSVEAPLTALVVSIFNVDFGYTGWTISQLLTNAYASNLEIVHTMFTSMYGLVQVFMPTSVILMVGAAMLKVDYKSWLKYIWPFVVGILVILLVFFAVLLYV